MLLGLPTPAVREGGLRRASLAAGVFLAAAVLSLAGPGGANGQIAPALRDRLAAEPHRAVPVVATLRAQVDPSRYAGRPRTLMRALRAMAARTQPEVLARAGTTGRRFWVTNAIALKLRPDRIRALAAMPSVESVDLDRHISVGQEPALSTPPPAPRPGPGEVGVVQSITQLPLDAIGARAVWSRYGVRGAGVLMGNIDTGVDAANPDLAGKIAGFRDFVNGRAEPYDDNGHGTHTIGTMVGGSASGEPIGVAPDARVLVAKALGANGSGLGSALLAAAQWMADPDGDPATADFPVVVNNSWNGGDPNDPWFRQVVRVWRAAGIVPVFAAGNSGPGARTIGSPSSYPEVLAVAAVDDAGVLADFSSRGPVTWDNPDGVGPVAGTVLQKADLAAPGVGIVSSVGSGYESYSGTSMAAPHVAGAIALLKQAAPALGASELIGTVLATATDLGPAGPDPGYGRGAVNALAAVASVLGPRGGDVPAPLAPPVPAPPEEAPAHRPAPTAAPAANPLRVVRARRPVVPRGGRLAVSGLLTEPARVRASLVRKGVGARSVRGTPRPVAVNRPAGPFRLVVPLRRAPVGRYRLVVQAETRAGRPLGRPVRLNVTVARPGDRRLARTRRLAQAVDPPAAAAAVGTGADEPVPPPAASPGVGRGGPAVVPIRLDQLVDGEDIDLSAVLGEFQLPPKLGILELGRLEDRTCRGVAVICLGLDRPLLNERLQDLVNRNLLTLALRNLGAADLAAILTQLTTLLDQGDLSQLVSVQRVDDRTLRLAPVGTLARVSGLPDVSDAVVGQLQVVGVIRCPPAAVEGLPRVCVA
jgi:subtilisin family serine protease